VRLSPAVMLSTLGFVKFGIGTREIRNEGLAGSGSHALDYSGCDLLVDIQNIKVFNKPIPNTTRRLKITEKPEWRVNPLTTKRILNNYLILLN
jgi:hypothetical protein